jgi:hypothetical protein
MAPLRARQSVSKDRFSAYLGALKTQAYHDSTNSRGAGFHGYVQRFPSVVHIFKRSHIFRGTSKLQSNYQNEWPRVLIYRIPIFGTAALSYTSVSSLTTSNTPFTLSPSIIKFILSLKQCPAIHYISSNSHWPSYCHLSDLEDS